MYIHGTSLSGLAPSCAVAASAPAAAIMAPANPLRVISRSLMSPFPRVLKSDFLEGERLDAEAEGRRLRAQPVVSRGGVHKQRIGREGVLVEPQLSPGLEGGLRRSANPERRARPLEVEVVIALGKALPRVAAPVEQGRLGIRIDDDIAYEAVSAGP